MVDGFHWTRVTSKQLRFLYETVTLSPTPPHICELASKADNALARPAPVAPQTTAPAGEKCELPKRNQQ